MRAVRRVGVGGVVRAGRAWPGPGGAACQPPGPLRGHSTRSLAARRRLLPQLPMPRRTGAAAAMAVAANVSWKSTWCSGLWAARQVRRAQPPWVRPHQPRPADDLVRIEPAGVPGRLLRPEVAAQPAHCPVDVAVAQLPAAGSDRLTHLAAVQVTGVEEQGRSPFNETIRVRVCGRQVAHAFDCRDDRCGVATVVVDGDPSKLSAEIKACQPSAAARCPRAGGLP